MKNNLKKIATMAAAVVAGTTMALGAAAPAQAGTQGPDLAVYTQKTGGTMGLYASGVSTIVNEGNTTIPAGTNVLFQVHNMPGRLPEVHATTVVPREMGKLGTLPVSINQNGARTTAALAPGESVTFNWTVFHYAPWHRVSTMTSVSGMDDVNASNNMAMTDNNGMGM